MHSCMYTLFSIIQTIHFLRFQICNKGKEMCIKTRWVKVRRKNNSKEKTKEIREKKKKKVSHVNSDLVHPLPIFTFAQSQ